MVVYHLILTKMASEDKNEFNLLTSVIHQVELLLPPSNYGSRIFFEMNHDGKFFPAE